MPSARAARRWESPFGPAAQRDRRTALAGRPTISVLDAAEDGFSDHAVATAALTLPIPEGFGQDRHLRCYIERIRQFCREHRIRVINHGLQSGGLAVNFGNSFFAAKFKLLWIGWTEDGMGYSVMTAHAFNFHHLWHEVDFALNREAAEESARYLRSRPGRRRSGAATVKVHPVRLGHAEDWW